MSGLVSFGARVVEHQEVRRKSTTFRMPIPVRGVGWGKAGPQEFAKGISNILVLRLSGRFKGVEFVTQFLTHIRCNHPFVRMKYCVIKHQVKYFIF